MKCRAFIWTSLLLLMFVCLACKRPLQIYVAQFIERQYAKQTLTSWGLQPTEEYLTLYRAMHNVSAAPVWPETLATNRVFSGEWTYDQLWASRPLTIGIYSQDKYDTERFRQNVRIPPDLVPHLRLDMLNTESEFFDALNTHDMVFFCGHANVGRGFYFAPDRGGRGLLPFGHERLAIPGGYRKPADVVLGTTSNGLLLISRPVSSFIQFPVHCKVFWCLTCRSEVYFRELWNKRYPHCRMVSTYYIWDFANNTRVLNALMEGLQRRQPLAAIIEHINAASAGDILLGHVAEIKEFGNATNLGFRLLSLY